MVAIAMPVFGRFVDRSLWEDSFLFAASFPIIGYFAWLFLQQKVPGKQRVDA